MKIEYIRNVQSGYMRVELERPLSKMEEEMLAHNVIEGLLPVQWQQENDKYLLRYDITGKQALDGLLANTLLGEKLMRSLLVGICIVIRQLEKYLLSTEGLLLSPEMIFWDYKTNTMYFCYAPEGEGLLQERLTQLMEYMLAKTDHRDISAVQLVYGVYEVVQNPVFCMEDLQKYLRGVRAEDSVNNTLEVEEVPAEENFCLEERSTENAYSEKNMHKPVWKERIVAWIKERIKKVAKSKMPEEVVVFDKEDAQQEESATTVLGMEGNATKGMLKYEGTNALPDILITKVPFLIGSASDCDGVIGHPNISRNHAKITYRDNTYFLEDLNSTNGTRVNGGLLSYKTKVSLKKNESIYFANEPYRFL